MDYFEYIRDIIANARGDPPLKGVKVVEFAHYILGPNIPRLLAQLGAEVVKVEPPPRGDRWKYASMWGGRGFYKGMRIDYLYLNSNKYFVGIDFKREEGRRLVIELVKQADVFVENFEPGTVDKYGLGYLQLREVNPRLIYVSASGYGNWGPLSRLPSYDVIGQAESGVIDTTGWEDGVNEAYRLPDYPGDWLPSTMAVSAIIAALIYRERTGKGQYIDLSQAASMQRFMYHFTYMSATGRRLKRSGFVDPSAYLSGVFKTADGKFVAIAAMTKAQYDALASAAPNIGGLRDLRDPESLWLKYEAVRAWASTKTLDELLELGKKLGVPIQPVLSDEEVVRDPWRAERGSVLYITDRLYGEVAVPGPIVKMGGTPLAVKWLARPVGYHNMLVLKRRLGLGESEVRRLREEGVIGYWDGQPGNAPPPGWREEEDPVFRGEKDEVET
ncbi:MAG: CaiB/BaiF CoA transferase family protein [Thermoproteus sp. AZ2]|jgi:crotonobetainyl-CoA:carnitine CoA-transferase CaiB-like acyl-CoA transferase|uniref:CaiB/BaiF CoA transferase family protein n=1 Tax=Thermoproteus sp. AZ2 TaxID=1609232 RepID=A0ACC6V1N0_9CREN|nr:MAG: carnitine dehydratase [Thermoproteus sp. AZ2]